MSGSNRAPGRVGALVVSASLVTGLLVSAVVRSERVSLATSAPAGPQAAAGVSPRQCEGCHLEVAAEWRESLHAQAFRDRVFHAEFAPHPAEECVACHAPLATDRVSPAQADTDQGITCISCHLDGGGHILAGMRPSRAAASAPHAVVRSRQLGSVDQCATCHEFAFPETPAAGGLPYDANVLQQATRTEWEHTGAARRGETCASCHMPRNADGRVDHRALGVSAELLARSLSITARASRDGGELVLRLTLRARHVGHAVPTGDVFRQLVVRAEVNGETRRVALQRYFGVRHVDGDLRMSEIDDTRVFPGRARVVTLRLPAAARGEPVRWSLAHARLDLDIAGARGLPEDAVLLPFASGTVVAPR